MSGIVLATTSADLEGRLTDAAFGSLRAVRGPLPHSPQALMESRGTDGPPQVVVLDAQPSTNQALELARELSAGWPQVSVLLVSDLWQEIGRDAMRAGVQDILHPDTDVGDFRVALDRAQEVATARALAAAQHDDAATADGGGRVIGVMSPKGGVGKTTVSTNIAVGLARTAPRSVVLVDLDVQFGDVASALDLRPDYFLPDVVRGEATGDTMLLKTFLTLHSTGLYAICGSENPADADRITGEMVTHLIRQLATEFDYVVVDTAPGLSDPTLAALDETSDLVLVTSMDVHGVRGLRKELDTLTQLGVCPDTRHIVLNFADRSRGLSTADVAATLGTDVDVVLPLSRSVPISVNQGIPLLQTGGRGAVTKELTRLVQRLAPVTTGRGRHRRRVWAGAR